MRIINLIALTPALLCVVASGMIYRQSIGAAQARGWRRHAAASIPALYTLVLLLAWTLPIQRFYATASGGHARQLALMLTLGGMLVAMVLPSGYFQLRAFEATGSMYAALGVRRFRNLVTYGDPMIHLLQRIDPASRATLTTGTLAERERRTRKTERIHWALLLASVPAAAWAIQRHDAWFALYLLIANIPMNVYPVLLQRYTRARLTRLMANGQTGDR